MLYFTVSMRRHKDNRSKELKLMKRVLLKLSGEALAGEKNLHHFLIVMTQVYQGIVFKM